VIIDVYLNRDIPYKQSPIMIILKRVYDKDLDPHAYTILVDRLWPRGLSKKELQPDEWLKDIAPDDSLRKWFGHDPAKWTQFKKKYLLELRERKDLLHKIKKLEKEKGEITLLYAARDTEHNNAVVLKEALGE